MPSFVFGPRWSIRRTPSAIVGALPRTGAGVLQWREGTEVTSITVNTEVDPVPPATTERSLTTGKCSRPAGWLSRVLLVVCLAAAVQPLVPNAAVAAEAEEVLAWGDDTYGQFGNGGDVDEAGTPRAVTGLHRYSAAAVVEADGGGYHSVARLADGRVYAWGRDESGQLGDGGTNLNQTSPVPVTSLGAGSDVVSLAAGLAHTLALLADGRVLAWGDDSNGQLGDGGSNLSQPTPVPVSGLGAGSGVVAVAAGGNHSLALLADGGVLAWGDDSVGQVGDDNNPGLPEPDHSVPVPVFNLGAGSGVVAVAAGQQHNLALLADGRVLAWGLGRYGQLGDGRRGIYAPSPVPVVGLGAGSGVVAVAAGGYHSLALLADGRVLAWGLDWFGQIGDGGANWTNDEPEPVPVVGLGAGSGVVAVEAGGYHNLALLADGRVMAWGDDERGQLGDAFGTTRACDDWSASCTKQLTPVPVAGLGPDRPVTAISAGFWHSLALRGVPVDTAPPLLTVPGPITADATGPSGAAVTFVATATDIPGSTPTVSCTPQSGSTFPLGTTTVTCTSTDGSGNTSTLSFPVTVRVPVLALTVPGPIVAEATGPSGAPVAFTATAASGVDPGPRVGCTPSSGSTFPLGMTTVTCTATDTSGNTRTGSFTVSVLDRTAPVVNVPGPQVAEATNASGAAVGFAATATDSVDPTATVVCSRASGTTFPLGTTTVSCTATDDSGNTDTGSFTINVVDSRAPVLALPSPVVADATSPSGAAVGFAAIASDTVDPSPTLVCSPPSGWTFPVGTTTVTCTATDDSDNRATSGFTVTIRGAGEQLAGLVEASAGLPPGNSLLKLATVAQERFAAGDTRAACVALDNYLRQVRLDTPKRISPDTQTLVADATRIRQVLRCAAPPPL